MAYSIKLFYMPKRYCVLAYISIMGGNMGPTRIWESGVREDSP